jgi:N-acetylglucosaminyl-diphospho-decaprenol L-rhamnosyltransferase
MRVAKVDIVVVSFNSAHHLRRCVESLARVNGAEIFVVDNNSGDDSLATVSDLSAHAIPLPENLGFAYGCNVGMKAGGAPYVLLLNPDATIDERSVSCLVNDLETNSRIGAVAPRIVGSDGELHHSLRRFPRLRSTYARALFLHRLFPRALWADEVIRRAEAYARPGAHEWVSGACVLLRRSLIEELGGLDERFFLYCEDTDLCLRTWKAGYEVRFQPEAVAVHKGGGSQERSTLLHVAVESRIRYARKHRARAAALLDQAGIALGALTHIVLARGGLTVRAGHARSLRRAVSPSRGAP